MEAPLELFGRHHPRLFGAERLVQNVGQAREGLRRIAGDAKEPLDQRQTEAIRLKLLDQLHARDMRVSVVAGPAAEPWGREQPAGLMSADVAGAHPRPLCELVDRELGRDLTHRADATSRHNPGGDSMSHRAMGR